MAPRDGSPGARGRAGRSIYSPRSPFRPAVGSCIPDRASVWSNSSNVRDIGKTSFHVISVDHRGRWCCGSETATARSLNSLATHGLDHSLGQKASFRHPHGRLWTNNGTPVSRRRKIGVCQEQAFRYHPKERRRHFSPILCDGRFYAGCVSTRFVTTGKEAWVRTWVAAIHHL